MMDMEEIILEHIGIREWVDKHSKSVLREIDKNSKKGISDDFTKKNISDFV